MNNIVKARKAYLCDCCSRKIERGDKYTFGKTREPRYPEPHPLQARSILDDIQIGITYIHWRLCLRDDCSEFSMKLEDA